MEYWRSCTFEDWVTLLQPRTSIFVDNSSYWELVWQVLKPLIGSPISGHERSFSLLQSVCFPCRLLKNHIPINKAVHGILCHRASSVFVTNGQMMPAEIFTPFNKGGGIVIRPKNIPLFCSWIMQQGAATWPSRRRWCQKETGIYLNTELLILFALPSCPPISFVFVFLFNLYFGFHLQNLLQKHLSRDFFSETSRLLRRQTE